jgi:hypothetical protein
MILTSKEAKLIEVFSIAFVVFLAGGYIWQALDEEFPDADLPHWFIRLVRQPLKRRLIDRRRRNGDVLDEAGREDH